MKLYNQQLINMTNSEPLTREEAVASVEAYFALPRFQETRRLFSARQVAEQQGAIFQDYSIARGAAEAFYERLSALFADKKQITTFGPYSPSQAVMMKRAGIEGIYLGGWATSAKGSADEDPGADLASYPLSQVPNEAAGIVRALLTADRNQRYQRFRMTAEELAVSKEYDFRPWIIADADTGHGGDAHVRNLIRRFVEAGVPGYHIEDQKPGTKKCGHQGGKVLVACDEQIKRLNAARFQLDVMRVPGIIVARTDAEAASLLENMSDERDQPFILGATNLGAPSFKHALLALQKHLHDMGATHLKGHELYRIADADLDHAMAWLEEAGLVQLMADDEEQLTTDEAFIFEPAYQKLTEHFAKTWEAAANVKTIGQAVADLLDAGMASSAGFEMSREEWKEYAAKASIGEVRQKAKALGIELRWDCDLPKTPEGYYQVKGGIAYAIARSLAVAPYADILWMETKTADLADAEAFAEAIHGVYPTKMLAYNLSPSFNWDTTGMTEEEMTLFTKELGELGFVFNFITYGGHQIDGLAADEFAGALQAEGMLALARVQRKFRLLDSPYKAPQTHVGGPRMDGALAASSGRTATTNAMGKGSTQFQHFKQTELPVSLLSGWINSWAGHYQLKEKFKVQLKPHKPSSTIMELTVSSGKETVASVVFTSVMDRTRQQILSVRDQNLYRSDLRRKRLMTLLHIFLINRYQTDVVHYLTPTDDNVRQCAAMKRLRLYTQVNREIKQIIIAEVATERVKEFLDQPTEIGKLIRKEDKEAILA